ncbi:MAG: C13 family peptidase [Candidatus Hermodarchaeota archaeon]
MESLTDYWANNRNDDEEWISFYFYAISPETNDRYQFTDSQYSISSQHPQLCFSYITQDYDYWAIIVAGSKEDKVSIEPLTYAPAYRFTHDALNMYNALKDTYDGFTDENIYLLSHYDEVYEKSVPRDWEMSKANFEWAIDDIKQFADSGDQVVICWFSHGSNATGDLKLETDTGESITASELDSNLDEISCNEMFIFISACHSGLIIDDLDDEPNRAVYAACKADEKGWVFDDEMSSWFSNATIRAIDPDFNASDADTDDPKDGRTSLREIFDFAYDFVTNLANETHPQTPQRWVGTTIGDDDEHFIYNGSYQ